MASAGMVFTVTRPFLENQILWQALEAWCPLGTAWKPFGIQWRCDDLVRRARYASQLGRVGNCWFQQG